MYFTKLLFVNRVVTPGKPADIGGCLHNVFTVYKERKFLSCVSEIQFHFTLLPCVCINVNKPCINGSWYCRAGMCRPTLVRGSGIDEPAQ